MALAARIRRLALALAAVGALVAPVLAGDRVTPVVDENPGRTRANSLENAPAPPAPAAAVHAPRTSVAPSDEGYAPRAHALTPAPAHSSELRAGSPVHATHSEVPPASRPRNDASGLNRANRPGPHRSKVSLRNLPATPGMGTLLRVNATAGREMSWVDFSIPSAPWLTRGGRAPPRAPTLSSSAPAALPGAPPTAANLRECPPSSGTAPDSPKSDTPVCARSHAPPADVRSESANGGDPSLLSGGLTR